MELLGLLGVGLLLSMFIMPWVAYANARRAQEQVQELLRQMQSQRQLLQRALSEIEQLKGAAPMPSAAPTQPVPPVQRETVAAAPYFIYEPAARDLETPVPPPPAIEIEPAAPVDPSPEPSPEPEARAVDAMASSSQNPADLEPAPPAPPERVEPPALAISEPPPLSEFEQRMAQWLQIAREWLFGGNLVAKVGLLILFIGVAFLVRLAAPYFSMPIEFRLAGVAASAIALLGWAWRIRDRRRGIALPAQGAALAILMLVTFGAFKLFNLIPASAAFALLFVLVAFTCALAVLQDAMWLAIFGISGGFAAPLLTASGSGNYVALFSYYCVLNAGVLAIALKRSWRALNVLGFAFTFVVGASWGVQRYLPENYDSTQPFLIIFWLFYVAIAVLYGTRRAPLLKSYVDGTLVFGVPTAGMALQYGLVKDMPFWMALSALVVALTYASLASLLWRWRGGPLRLLVESFLALAVVFGTLAIPLAFDGRWTSAVWAVEGAAIVWIGLKQGQALAWRFGIAVQVASWIAFVTAMTGIDAAAALTNNIGLGFLLLGGAGVLMALMFHAQANPSLDAEERARARFGTLAGGFIIAAAVWLLLGLWVEAWLRLDGGQRATVLVATALLLAVGLHLLARRAAWRLPEVVGGAVAVCAGVVFVCLMLARMDWHNFSTYSQAGFGELLREGPLLGGLLLCGGALLSALAFKQRATDEPAKQRAVAQWFLLAVFWWCGFALHGMAHAVGYLTSSAAGTSQWYSISFWAAYGIGLAVSGLVWAQLAARRALLSERAALQILWPALSWGGGAVFMLQAMAQLAWARGRWWELSATSLTTATKVLVGSPLLGALVLCGIAALGIARMTRDVSAEPVPRPARHWMLGFGLVWYLLLLDPLAQFTAAVLALVEPIEQLWQPRNPDSALLLVALSAVGFIQLAVRRASPALRWLATPAMALQAVVSAIVLAQLYGQGTLPRLGIGIALVGCWWAVAWSLRQWTDQAWRLNDGALRWMHFGRVIAPWLMLMPVVSLNLARWVWPDLPASNAGVLSGQWPDYIASWSGIFTLLLLLRQAEHAAPPVQPLHDWYRAQLIPLAALWGVLLVIYWNLRQDGSMAPLPYLPLLNPLDLTSGFVAVLAMQVWRANREALSSSQQLAAVRASMLLGFAWFNLMLLRTAAQYLPVPYRFADLYASQFVQVMLSIVWTLSAFFLMRVAAGRGSKALWGTGAALLVVVIAKLFLIDLSKVGDGARVVSFIGVGGLMLLIEYLAPRPRGAGAGNQPGAQQA